MKLLQNLCLVIQAIQLYQCESATKCNTVTQYLKFSRCCAKCPPGSYLINACTIQQDTECRRCEEGQYQSIWSLIDHCQLHTYCDPNGGFVTVSPGNTLDNAVCLCAIGKHCINEDCEICVQDMSCEPGSGVVIPADRKFTNTACEECKSGYYSNVSSSVELCRKWTNCGSREELRPGNSTTDVKCKPWPAPVTDKTPAIVISILVTAILVALIAAAVCHRDYLKEMMRRFHKQLYQCASPSDCDTKTQYFKADKCCFKCGPGSFMVTECESSVYSSCQPCSSGFYQSAWTKADHCSKHSACDAGDFEVIKDGDLFNNVQCLCKEGKHCANTDCEVCRNDDKCKPGYGVKTPGDRKNGTICEECKVGFYSNVTSSTEPCMKWAACAALGLMEATAGSAQTDVVCSVPLHDNGPLNAAVACLTVLLIILIVLFISSRMGFLDQAMDGLQKLWNRRREQKKEDPEKAAPEDGLLNPVQVALVENGEIESLCRGVQEVGKDSHPSEEEQQDQPAQPGTPIEGDNCVSGHGTNGNAGRECSV
uniref:tumor necrosis factor receptor superfamily member 11A-like n=1 Tax=Pristiophorus japonicus TaxID=55135 RepID=UPI00398E7F87